jgi:WD40 repeat protein
MTPSRHLYAHPSISLWRCLAPLLLTLGACSLHNDTAIPATKMHLPAEVANAYTISFLPDGHLLVETNDYQFWYQTPPNGAWKQIPFNPTTLCKGTFYGQGRILPDGRIGMLCTGDVQHSTLYYTMVAYNWTSGALEPLVAGLLPDNGVFTWKPDMRRGVFATAGSYSTLYWITSTSTQPITITLTDGRISWFVPDSVRERDQYDQGHRDYRAPQTVGNVGAVAWSPDRKYVAFWGTLASIGRPSNPLQRLPWDLYLLDVTTLDVRRIHLDVYDAYHVAWSPNSRWVAYIAPEEGLLLLDLQTDKTTLIQRGNFQDLAWSPDGQQITTIKCNGAICGVKGYGLPEIWTYDLSALITGTK